MKDNKGEREESSAVKIMDAHRTTPQSQSERFIAKARELGLDEREETFNAALSQVAKHRVKEKDRSNDG